MSREIKRERRQLRIAEKNAIHLKSNKAYETLKGELLKTDLPITTEDSTLCYLSDRAKNFCYKTESIYIFDPKLYKVIICPNQTGGVELYRFEIYKTGEGLGNHLLTLISSIAITSNIEITLIIGAVGSVQTGTRRNDVDEDGLRKFYHRNGFRRNSTDIKWSNRKELDEFWSK